MEENRAVHEEKHVLHSSKSEGGSLREIPIKEANKERNKKSLRYQRDKDRETVRGIFRFFEVPGGVMEFCYKAYKEDKVERYKMHDGQMYTIPLGVAKHLNKNMWYPIHAFKMTEDGVSSQFINQKVRRCSFQSLEFVDIDDFNTSGNKQIEYVNMV
jgi:hypothetical protein